MQVDLDGQVALLVHDDSDVARAVAAALARNGARVVAFGDGDAAPGHDMLVVCARGDVAGVVGRAIPATRSPGGRVVTIMSAAGLVPLRGDAARAAAHGALVMLTRALALELGAAGVRVNAVAVGALEGGGDARMLSHVPLGRAGAAAEVADAALFLLDPENAYTTGHVLVVDGGWTAGYGRDF